MFGLSVDTLRRIRSVFSKFPKIQKVVLYGSRAKGNYKTGSDIDITLIGKGLTLNNTVYPLMEELDELYLPYMFDISIFNQLNNLDFIDHILRVGKTFYQKAIGMGEGWEQSSLGAICELVAGQSPMGSNYNSLGNGLPFYQGKKEFRAKYLGAPTKWTTQVTQEAVSGDILLSVRAPVGPANFATGRICIGRGLVAIRAGEQVNREFIFYLLLSMQDRIKGNEGAVFASISKGQVESIRFSKPPLPEQKRIVAILDEAFAAIAIATANTEKNLTNARELFETELARIFDNPGTDGLSEDVTTAGWAVKTLGDLCEIARGGSPRPIGEFITVDVDGVNWIRIGDATASTKYIYETKQKIKPEGIHRSRMVYEGDLLLSNSMSFGKPYIMKTSGCIHDGWLVLRDKSGLFTSDYLYYFLGSPVAYRQFDSRAAGSTVRNLNIDLVRTVEVPLPSILEQNRIAALLDKLSAARLLLTNTYETKLSTLANLKQSLLHMAFTGELTTNFKAIDRTLSDVS